MPDIEIHKGSKTWVGKQVTERDDGNVTATAVFQVFDVDGSNVQNETPATITGSGTAKVYVEGIVDTSVAGFVIDDSYEVKFTITIGSAIEIHKRHITIIE